MSSLTLPDGRELSWDFFGDAVGTPMFYLHGAGSSRLEAVYADGYAKQLRIRLIAVDRPGYGRSTAAPDPGFVPFAQDLLHLADTLQLARFGVIGMSAGGPHALHLAALARSRVAGVALINASSDASHPAWRATPLMFRLLKGIAASRPLLRLMATRLKNDARGTCIRAAQREEWDERSIIRFVAAVNEGMRQHDAVAMMVGEADRVLLQPWQLEWSRISCRVLALCGARDPGRWFYRALSERLSKLSYVQIPGGHQPFVPEAAWERIAREFAMR